ncbi:MAG: hypothetical protein EOO48_08915 [Flavobacterium sp.]|nr:MAG: hypothetical protein EOO48_08915 [Flavobacterium sp.]
MKQLLFFLLLSNVMLGQTVYKTPSGKKYHTAGCHMVKNTSEAISISDAKALGLEPCKICKPDSGARKTTAEETTSGENAVSSQCKGRTKAGTKCRHMTKIGNGYCFQHQSQS